MTKSKHDLANVTISILVDFYKKLRFSISILRSSQHYIMMLNLLISADSYYLFIYASIVIDKLIGFFSPEVSVTKKLHQIHFQHGSTPAAGAPPRPLWELTMLPRIPLPIPTPMQYVNRSLVLIMPVTANEIYLLFVVARRRLYNCVVLVAGRRRALWEYWNDVCSVKFLVGQWVLMSA